LGPSLTGKTSLIDKVHNWLPASFAREIVS
jgi:hypothetical protein